jgi:hypothetical protein
MMSGPWIVMTSAAHVGAGKRTWGTYRNVALVMLTPDYAASGMVPKMISTRAVGVEKILHLGHHSVGTTYRCAYQKAIVRAEEIAAELNAEEERANG